MYAYVDTATSRDQIDEFPHWRIDYNNELIDKMTRLIP